MRQAIPLALREHLLSGTIEPEHRQATILKRISHEFSEEAGDPDWYAITEAAERTVFEEKGLYPNVDLYSASVYTYLGIPTDLIARGLDGRPIRLIEGRVIEEWM